MDDVASRIAPRFGHAEPHRRAGAYLRGRLSLVRRKNGWQLASLRRMMAKVEVRSP